MLKVFSNRVLVTLIVSFILLVILSCSLTKLSNASEYVTSRKIPITGSAVLPTAEVETPDVEITQIIELTDTNSVVMDQVYSNDSVALVMLELARVSALTPRNKPIYLVLNTPGGSVDAGLSLISFAKALPQEIKTLSIFSASMGFQTAQNLGERLVLPSSTVMSHRATFGLKGEAHGELFQQLAYTMQILDGLDNTAAFRMGITYKQYQTLIADQYWANGPHAVEDKSADRLVLAKCSKDLLNGTKTINVETMFGAFGVVVSKCPLITGILKVTAPAKELTNEDLATANQYVHTMFVDKKAFVHDYILTNKFNNFNK